MNVLKVAHAAIRAKFWTRFMAFAFAVVGYSLLGFVNWRAALGVYLVMAAQEMRRASVDT